MKKYIILAIITLAFTSCGVGTYSISSGKADNAEISFIDQNSYDITLKVDNTSTHNISTIKEKAYKQRRITYWQALYRSICWREVCIR